MISIKCALASNLTFLNPRNLLFFLKSQKNVGNFALQLYSKLVHVDTKKSRSIYLKFSVEENEPTPSFQKPQEVAKN